MSRIKEKGRIGIKARNTVKSVSAHTIAEAAGTAYHAASYDSERKGWNNYTGSIPLRITRAAAKAGGKLLIHMAAVLGPVALLIIFIVVFFGYALYLSGGPRSSEKQMINDKVESYTPLIVKYASAYGIPDYVELIKAVMMQESRGEGTDPMQCSECPYNRKYPNAPNGIPEPEYSIDCGTHYLADCLIEAGCENPFDLDHIRLALQGYNYGNGYISWAIIRDGRYTLENATLFSDEQANKHGWSGYGDKEYAPHVIRYYSYRDFGLVPGNGTIVDIAARQIGNVGGAKFWSWYGFSFRVDWCAIFVSWCANQCGYLESGVIPRFSVVERGEEWFRSRNAWQGRSYIPKAGDLIFLDWGPDGECDHVGIVESCDGQTVVTIEGNSGDTCRRCEYLVGWPEIYGYGVPGY